MQLKEIAKGLREAATLLFEADDNYAEGMALFKAAYYGADSAKALHRLRATFTFKYFTTQRDTLDPLELNVCGLTYRCPPKREALLSMAERLERGYTAGGSWERDLESHRRDKIPTGRRPPRSVLQDFLADGEVENAQQYAELTGSEAILAELLKL